MAVDWFSDPVRIGREALGLKHLGDLVPADSVPRFLFEDPAHHLLAMTAVLQPHVNWKTLLLAGQVDLGHVRQFASLLAAIHRNAWAKRAELAAVFAVRHTLGCMLARVAGRSPLEYLSAGERAWQRAAVLSMMGDLPGDLGELIDTFLERE